jgi:hypothetical protein
MFVFLKTPALNKNKSKMNHRELNIHARISATLLFLKKITMESMKPVNRINKIGMAIMETTKGNTEEEEYILGFLILKV